MPFCAYCGKPIPAHMMQTASGTEKKKDNLGLIIAIIVVIAIVATIVVSAGVYFYVSQVTPTPHFTYPTIQFAKDGSNLTVTSITPVTTTWNEIEVLGDYQSMPTHLFVTAGDKITGCSGLIRRVYSPANIVIVSFDFTE